MSRKDVPFSEADKTHLILIFLVLMPVCAARAVQSDSLASLIPYGLIFGVSVFKGYISGSCSPSTLERTIGAFFRFCFVPVCFSE